MNAPIESRLRWADQRILDAVVDAQCRDWTGDRPDRVGFARLAQVRFQLAEAGRRRPPPTVLVDPAVLVDPVRDLLGAAAWVGTLVLVLLLADDPAAPLTLAGAAAAGAIAAQAVTSALRWRRDRRARNAPATAWVPIDDRQFYTHLAAVIEGCADDIRRTQQARWGAAADQLDVVRSWLVHQRDAIR